MPRSGGADGLAELLEIMRRLRAPGGCPWDRAQDFASIAPYTLEEAYEVVDAIERADMHDLRDELGDLLFQVVFHAQMAAEQGEFDFAGVAQAISRKMVRRHPHVFGESGAAGAGETALAEGDGLNQQWEKIKAAEREAKRGRSGRAHGLMDDLPRGLPAIKRAEKMQRRAARVRFDWRDAAEVLPKLREELEELERAVAVGDDARAAEEELGDLMFTAVNLARHLGVDAERALAASTAKFEARFRCMEALAPAETAPGPGEEHLGPLAGVDRQRLEALWADSKRSLLERDGD